MNTKFKVLTYLGQYVDENLLHNGIYTAIKPTLHLKDTTIDLMISNADKAYDFAPSLKPYMENYIKNLKQCKLEIVKIQLLNNQ